MSAVLEGPRKVGGARPGAGRHEKVTPQVKQRIVDELLKNGGRVSHACTKAGITTQSAYRHRDTDTKFAAAWDKAVEQGMHVYDDEAKDRALDGSDSLLSLVLTSRHPAYKRDRVESTTTIVFLGPALDSKPARDPALEVQRPAPSLEAANG